MPKLPAGGGNKRRMPENPTPEMLKRMRTEDTSSVSRPTAPSPSPSKGKKRVTIQSEEDDEQEFNYAAGAVADVDEEDEEGGRFFGGGLTDEQKQILSIFENAEATGSGGAQDVGKSPIIVGWGWADHALSPL